MTMSAGTEGLQPAPSPGAGHGYRVVDGRICHARPNRKGGEVVDPLADFACRIEKQIKIDDGFESSLFYEIAGASADGVALPAVRVSAVDFGALAWVAKHWGVRGVIEPGQSARERLRVAIQKLSRPREETIFRHTGWRKVGPRWIFLYNGGAVGADDVSVELEAPLDRYVLPPRVKDIRQAIETSLRLLDVGPLSLTVPLLGAVYLAPVSSIVEPDTTLFMQGGSGALKSTLSGLFLRHYGRFHRKALPGNWTSTDNSLEYRLSLLKDVLCAIDDYTPQPSNRAQREMEARAERVLRNVGNRATRGRMRADLSQRPDRPPRGLLLSSGEDLPPGSSLRARLFVVEVNRVDLDEQLITQLEKEGGRLGHALRGFIEWLAPQMARLHEELPALHLAMRDRFQGTGDHLRQPEAMAHLFLGFELFLRFACQHGVLAAAEAEVWRDKASAALEESVAAQADSIREVDIADMMVDGLRTLLQQGRVQLANLDGQTRPDRGPNVGREEGGDFFLLPRAVKHAVHAFFRESGENWNPSLKALGGALLRKGFVRPGPGRGRNQLERRMNGERIRGWLMPATVLRPAASPAAGSPAVSGDGGTVAKRLISQQFSFGEASLPPDPPGLRGLDCCLNSHDRAD
jgi:hypothetical protein